MRTDRRLLVVLGLGLVLGAAGCGEKIGDSCKTNVDCSRETDRTCDISQPGGYCTIDGCDERSCPDEAVCIRFFPRLFLSRECRPEVAEDCAPDELCLEGDRRCAPRTSERRYCALECDDNGDCRSGYECRPAGRDGSIALVSKPGATIKFCAPSGR